jgi:hypothetical protein
VGRTSMVARAGILAMGVLAGFANFMIVERLVTDGDGTKDIVDSLALSSSAWLCTLLKVVHQLRVVRQHNGMMVDEFAVVVPTPAGKEAGYGPRL